MFGRLIDAVALPENGTSCGGLQLPQFLVNSGEIFLEACLGLDLCCLASPEIAVVVEEPGLEQDLKRNPNNLGMGVWSVSGGGVVNHIFDLIDQGFEPLVAVVGSLESLGIFL